MAGITDFLAAALANHLFNDPSYTPPTNVFVGLFTAAPTDAGGGTEVTGGSYARVSTAASDWDAATGTGQKSNGNAITFPAPTGNWGDVTHFGFFDALTVGNLLAWASFGTTHAINSGNPAPSFAAAALTLDMNNN